MAVTSEKKKNALRKKPKSRDLVKSKVSRVPDVNETRESHPWRLCPLGEHWVRFHPRNTPNGGVTTVTGYCRANSSKKDQIYAFELTAIANKFFESLESLPTPDDLGYRNGNAFDRLIAGWTKFWNEVLKPDQSLDPNLIKALIATESSFDPNAKALASKKNWARGLTQVTDQTLQILSDEKGEIKDHLVNIDQTETQDANLNIAAGIRWLFHKKDLLERKAMRQVSWEEAVMEYKSYTKDISAKKPKALKKRAEFIGKYKQLKGNK